ncbi:MAG: hypothetical protein H5U40_00460 [Polyangiaceae bacterium]|nr:hypothetical protein [Polyangiaceae bacterium]
MRAVLERARSWFTPRRAVELFAFGNLGFLAVDIYVAHSYNDFASDAEWVPVVFSAVSPFWLAATWALERKGRARAARVSGVVLGAVSIAIGVTGLVLHLESEFFESRTLASLVYAAPFAGPLAYTGLGLLLILDRVVDAEDPAWGPWVVALALGGFVGNLALTLADHAQSGFFDWREWIGVGAAAFAVAFLLLVLARPEDALLHRATRWMMLAQIGVGFLGFALHGLAYVRGPMDTLWENAVYGAPPFAPLLFADMGILALIGLWGMGAPSRQAGAIAVSTSR